MNAIPWLPDCALMSARSVEPVAQCFQGWAADWLVTGDITVSPRWEKSGTTFTDTQPALDRKAYRLLINNEGRNELACAMLDRSVTERNIRTPMDRAVIDHLLGNALEELSGRLDSLFPDPGDGTRPFYTFFLPIGISGGANIMRLETSARALSAIVKGWAGIPRPAMPAPEPARSALEGYSIGLSARLGTSDLPLPDLERLEVGDVLALDLPVENPLNALIDGKPVAASALTLLSRDDCFMLQIERPPSQW